MLRVTKLAKNALVMGMVAALAVPASSAVAQTEDRVGDAFCSVDVKSVESAEVDARQAEQLGADAHFEELAAEAGIQPSTAAEQAAPYLTDEEVRLVLDGLQSNASVDAVGNQAIWDLKCGKAIAGYALYKAQGWLVCGPMGLANPLAGLVCKLITGAAGGKVDFNQLCD
ncbi:hypothetical protein [uncultured Corynebacterium sp.]|uniref:hypothetical protein n=1 Tax=uncultured Corynebacterium sp. TaxID=159447 RepID=UPI0025CD4AA0|nr:hypothetical protein [uncultured Corynebacterium sp.]